MGSPPTQDGHHQDYYICSRESRTKLSFATIASWVMGRSNLYKLLTLQQKHQRLSLNAIIRHGLQRWCCSTKLGIQRDQIYALFQLKAFSKNRQLVSQKNQIRNQVPRCEIGIGHFFKKNASQTWMSFLVSETSRDEMVKGDMSRLVFDWILLSSQSPQLFPKMKRFRYPQPANSMRCMYLMIRKNTIERNKREYKK